MGYRWKNDSEKLKKVTERILYEARREIRLLDLAEKDARRNIREFLEHLPQFHDLEPKEPPTGNSPGPNR